MPTNENGAPVRGPYKKKSPGRGGARPNSGRPRKVNAEDYVQVTCVLRKDTVEALKSGAGGKNKFFGAFLQFHLDRFPVPSHEEYLAMRERKPSFAMIGRRRTPVIRAGNVGRALRAAHRPPKRKPLTEQEKLRRDFMKTFTPV